jgi:hypothetical protein
MFMVGAALRGNYKDDSLKRGGIGLGIALLTIPAAMFFGLPLASIFG